MNRNWKAMPQKKEIREPQVPHTSSSTASAIRQGLLAGFAGLPGVWSERRKIQAARMASIDDIARAINWSIPALRKKKIVLRAW